jgi:S1-C subfamily serine protease
MQNKRLSADSRRMIAQLQAQNDSLANVSAGKAAGLDSVIQDLKRQRDQLAASLRSGGDVNQRQIDALTKRTQGVMSAAAVDWATILDRTNAGIAFVTVRTSGDSSEEGTAFGITPSGLLATNKHMVLDRAGKPYKDIVVKFADTKDHYYCHFVSMAPGDVDIAFIQINDAGTYPVVAGIAANPSIRVGDPIMVLGFPLGSGLMGANGPDLIPRTTPGWGNVSKSQPTDLQLDAFAAAGSSGSPVFNSRGLVVGVVYGGNRDAAGHVVYAVPGAKLLEALPAAARSILK